MRKPLYHWVNETGNPLRCNIILRGPFYTERPGYTFHTKESCELITFMYHELTDDPDWGVKLRPKMNRMIKECAELQ